MKTENPKISSAKPHCTPAGSTTNLLFAQNLRLLRSLSLHTQQHIADSIYVSRSTYAKYESGRIPSRDIVLRISAFFGVEPDFLFEENPTFIRACEPVAGDIASVCRGECCALNSCALIPVYIPDESRIALAQAADLLENTFLALPQEIKNLMLEELILGIFRSIR